MYSCLLLSHGMKNYPAYQAWVYRHNDKFRLHRILYITWKANSIIVKYSPFSMVYIYIGIVNVGKLIWNTWNLEVFIWNWEPKLNFGSKLPPFKNFWQIIRMLVAIFYASLLYIHMLTYVTDSGHVHAIAYILSVSTYWPVFFAELKQNNWYLSEEEKIESFFRIHRSRRNEITRGLRLPNDWCHRGHFCCRSDCSCDNSYRHLSKETAK